MNDLLVTLSQAEELNRYRVFEPEIPCGIAIKNKRRRRAKDQNLNVRIIGFIDIQSKLT